MWASQFKTYLSSSKGGTTSIVVKYQQVFLLEAGHHYKDARLMPNKEAVRYYSKSDWAAAQTSAPSDVLAKGHNSALYTDQEQNRHWVRTNWLGLSTLK
jgi:hypothetical protein